MAETDADKLRFIEEVTADVDAVQQRVLAEILGRNADAEYLATRCGLGGATDRATFRAKVPMVTHEDLCIRTSCASPTVTALPSCPGPATPSLSSSPVPAPPAATAS